MKNILKYNRFFSAYEYIYATLVFKMYSDLSDVIKPGCINNSPSLLECCSILQTMHSVGRAYNIGDIFEDAKSAKPTTIRAYISQRKNIRPDKIAGLLYDNYFNRPEASPIMRGNRLNILKHISKRLQDAKITFTHKQKEPLVYQYGGQIKVHVEWGVYLVITIKG